MVDASRSARYPSWPRKRLLPRFRLATSAFGTKRTWVDVRSLSGGNRCGSLGLLAHYVATPPDRLDDLPWTAACHRRFLKPCGKSELCPRADQRTRRGEARPDQDANWPPLSSGERDWVRGRAWGKFSRLQLSVTRRAVNVGMCTSLKVDKNGEYRRRNDRWKSSWRWQSI